jgi:hypothetical protein
MKRVLFPFLAFLAGTLGHAATAGDERNCLDVRAISGFEIKSEQWVFVDVPDRRYKVTFSMACLKRTPHTMRVEGRGRCLAPGDVVAFVHVPSDNSTASGIEERCIVRSVEPVSEAKP